MINKKLALPLILVAIGVVLSTAFSYSLATTPIGDTVKYSGLICACKNSLECHEGIPEASCNHNLITNAGKNAIESLLTNQGGGNFSYLALSNDSADSPVATDTNFTTELTGGLARAGANYYDMGNGNWSLIKTWTADATFMSVNTTGVYNNSAAGKPTLLAAGTFSSVNLNSGDTLTINYSLALG